MRSHLLNETTADLYRRSVTEGVDRVAAKLATTERPHTGISVDALAPVINGIDLDKPLEDPAAALDELEEVYLRDAVYFHHPRYLGHLNCPVVIPAVLGEAILSAVNSSMDTWDQSIGGTLIERRLIDWTAYRIGLGPRADGVFTSGGSQSNFHALLLARDEACRIALQRARAEGRELTKAELLPRLRILASEASHFSVRKSAAMLGMGYEAVISVPVDLGRRMDTSALALELESCAREGLVPMAVVATMRHHRLRVHRPAPRDRPPRRRALHVDARGRRVRLRTAGLPTRRHLLDGIEHADSVTVDYHKSFFQPVSSSAVLVRERDTLRHATYHADYLNPRRMAEERIPNQVDKSLQTTRRFDALKLWMTLRVMGADGIGSLFDEVIDLAAAGWELLDADPRFEVVVRPTISTLVFRYVPAGDLRPDLVDEANLHARKALFASGEAVVAGTKVDGRQYLKFTLLNPQTTASDISAVLDLLAVHAEQYLGASLAVHS